VGSVATPKGLPPTGTVARIAFAWELGSAFGHAIGCASLAQPRVQLAEIDTMNPEETLARWWAEEREVRERLAEKAGYSRAEQLDGRSGLETLQAIFAGELPPPPMGDTIGFVPIYIERGILPVVCEAQQLASARRQEFVGTKVPDSG